MRFSVIMAKRACPSKSSDEGDDVETLDLSQAIAIVTGLVIPLLVGLVAKINASSALKSALNLGLSALTSVLTTVIPGETTWVEIAVTFALTWAVSIASHYGLWKPTNTSDVVQLKTAQFGLGGTRRAA